MQYLFECIENKLHRKKNWKTAVMRNSLEKMHEKTNCLEMPNKVGIMQNSEYLNKKNLR